MKNDDSLVEILRFKPFSISSVAFLVKSYPFHVIYCVCKILFMHRPNEKSETTPASNVLIVFTLVTTNKLNLYLINLYSTCLRLQLLIALLINIFININGKKADEPF